MFAHLRVVLCTLAYIASTPDCWPKTIEAQSRIIRRIDDTRSDQAPQNATPAVGIAWAASGSLSFRLGLWRHGLMKTDCIAPTIFGRIHRSVRPFENVIMARFTPEE